MAITLEQLIKANNLGYGISNSLDYREAVTSRSPGLLQPWENAAQGSNPIGVASPKASTVQV
jgi:hypothetical protein